MNEDESSSAVNAQRKSPDCKSTAPQPVRPSIKADKLESQGHGIEEESMGEEEVEEIEELVERVEKMERQIKREEEDPDVPVVKEPVRPSKEDVAKHEATHAHYKSWCKYCNQGLAIRDQHRRKQNRKKGQRKVRSGEAEVPDTEANVNGQVKYSIDYMRMDSTGDEESDGKAMSTMVMVNHEDGGVFAYATPGKGIQGDRYWLPKRMSKDIDNCGTKEARIQAKSDQEPSVVAVQEEIREIRRGKTICVNSPVGESECNGRAENAIRRVEVKVRTLRAHIEDKTRSKVDMSKPFATWLIRWAGEVITKYTKGKDGKTSWHRRRGEECAKPIVPVGEKVLYLPLKTAEIHRNKGEPKMFEGIWLGINGRTEEVFIGTRKGVVKCRTVQRLPEDERWDTKLLHEMQGTTWQPVPGYKSDHVPVEIDHEGRKAHREEEDNDAVDYEAIPIEEDPAPSVKTRGSPMTDIRVTNKDTERFGCTPGCPACEHVRTNRKIPRGVGHSSECRKRIRELIGMDEDAKERIDRADERKRRREEAVGNLAKESLRTPNAQTPKYLARLQKEMQLQMAKLVAEDIDVSEIYSPPRVAQRAEVWGLKKGWGLDLTTTDVDGKAWDFSRKEMRDRAINKIKRDKPLLIVGSPTCTDWSTIMQLNWPKMKPEDIKRRMKEARRHLRFCVAVYKHQAENGRYYVHEHPMNAKSWKELEMQKMAKREDSILAKLDQCQYGLWIKDKFGWSSAKKPTKMLTNSPCIARQLMRRCPGKHTHVDQRHTSLFYGVAKKAQVYPDGLCDAICKGLRDQIECDKRGNFVLAVLNVDDAESGREESQRILGSLAMATRDEHGCCNLNGVTKLPTATEEDEEELQVAWDDVSGRELEPSKVRLARKEEIDYVHKSNLYTKVPREKAKKLKAKVITVRWIDINKGDSIAENYRSRLVAREIKTDGRPDLFAATPPLEALKVVLSMLTSGNKGEKLMVNDVSRAYFCAPARRQVFVELPSEDKSDGEDMVGELSYSMYGTRDAAQNWGEECASTMQKLGFRRGKASPCTFYHPSRHLRTYIHGDDFVTAGMEKDLTWMKTEIEKFYQIKTQILGPDAHDQQQVRVLNRILTWHEKGIRYEADPRHAEIVIDQLGLKEAKGVVAPGTKDEGTTKENCEVPLEGEEASQYRAIVARLNYLAADRPDIAFAVKELARNMSAPTQGSRDRLKRLGRYLVHKPRAVVDFEWQDVPTRLRAFTDADWAGCKSTRKSTSGGVLVLGKHTVKTWSKTQSLVALSSGESELYAALKASAEGLGMLSLLRDFGYWIEGEVLGDASAALGIIQRRGLGRTRHIDTGLLWIQQTAAEKRLAYTKVLGTNNPADLMTKHLTQEVIERHCNTLKVQFPEGRAATAPTLSSVFELKAPWQLDDEADTTEENDSAFEDRIQAVFNELWIKKWKTQLKAQQKKLEG